MKTLLATALSFLFASVAFAQINILFVGNSFTHGNYNPVQHYNASAITDPDGTGYGGVPGIFKKMTDQAGLSYDVTIEAVSAKTLKWHSLHKAAIIGQSKWNIVVLQEFSREPLPASHGGNPDTFTTGAAACGSLVLASSPSAKILMCETWSYPSWVGKNGYEAGVPGLLAMQSDLQASYANANTANNFAGVCPVGEAFMEVVNQSLTDPSNAVTPGKFQLWSPTDNKHPSPYGAYLSAAVLFCKITGLNPCTLPVDASSAAGGLGINSTDATKLNEIAYKITHSTL